MKAYLLILFLLPLFLGCSAVMQTRKEAITKIRASRQPGFHDAYVKYRGAVRGKLMKNFDKDACRNGKGAKIAIKIDENGNIASIKDKSILSPKKCVDSLILTVNKTAPFPAPDQIIREYIINDELIFGVR